MKFLSNLKSGLFKFILKPIVWIGFPFLIVAFAYLLIDRDPLFIINSEDVQKVPKFHIANVNDKDRNGNSECHLVVNSFNQASYKYTLKEGYTFPYSGIMIAAPDGKFFDLSSYDYFKIKIKASKGKRIAFILASFINNYTPPFVLKKEYVTNEVFNTLMNSQYILNVSNDYSEHVIPFKNFKTPDWWYMGHDPYNKFGPPDFSQIRYINFSQCNNIKTEVEDIVDIREISFHVDLVPFYKYSASFIIFYFSVVGFIYYWDIRKKKKDLTLSYKKVESSNHQDKEEELVFEYLNSNFQNEELTVTDVQNAIGIHERKISGIIKNKKDLTFRQYLNIIRISEAKNLLTQTDFPISEIALKVGYGNASHFNKVFKASENCSPNEFRKNSSHFSSKK